MQCLALSCPQLAVTMRGGRRAKQQGMQVVVLFSQDLKRGERRKSPLVRTVKILGNWCESWRMDSQHPSSLSFKQITLNQRQHPSFQPGTLSVSDDATCGPNRFQVCGSISFVCYPSNTNVLCPRTPAEICHFFITESQGIAAVDSQQSDIHKNERKQQRSSPSASKTVSQILFLHTFNLTDLV